MTKVQSIPTTSYEMFGYYLLSLCWKLYCHRLQGRSHPLQGRGGVTNSPFVHFSVRDIFDFALVPLMFFESYPYLVGVTQPSCCDTCQIWTRYNPWVNNVLKNRKKITTKMMTVKRKKLTGFKWIYMLSLTVIQNAILPAETLVLTHWGRVTHICVSKLTIIGWENGLSPGRRQAIIWTSAGILFITPLGTNFSEILIEILIFSFKKMRLKISSAKWRPFCLGLNVLSESCTEGGFLNDCRFEIPQPSVRVWCCY